MSQNSKCVWLGTGPGKDSGCLLNSLPGLLEHRPLPVGGLGLEQLARPLVDDVAQRGEAGVPLALILGNPKVPLEAAAGELLKVDAGVGAGVHVGEEAVRGAHAMLTRAQGHFLNKMDSN